MLDQNGMKQHHPKYEDAVMPIAGTMGAISKTPRPEQPEKATRILQCFDELRGSRESLALLCIRVSEGDARGPSKSEALESSCLSLRELLEQLPEMLAREAAELREVRNTLSEYLF